MIGYGVIASKRIPKGTITWVQDAADQVFDAGAWQKLGARNRRALKKYTWINRDGHRVLCWDFARSMNHSCDARSLSPGFDYEIAVSDIEPGEQLTSDYGALNLEEALHCACRSHLCCGVIRGTDFEDYAEWWDQRIREAFPLIRKVPQPLWPWVIEKAQTINCLLNPATIPSIRSHRFRPQGYSTVPIRRRNFAAGVGQPLGR